MSHDKFQYAYFRFKPLHGIIIFHRFCLVDPLITQWLWIPSHTDEFQPMLEVWHEIHTMSTQLWLVSKMVPLMVLISELQNLIIFLGQSRVSLFMHTRKPNVKLWALSTNQPCVVSKNPNARKQFL
ncbi:uncharacterized protein LOC130758097 isoform X2 [Actinidia eriantha]|uniref:uncharacterized protein LOC130758097 isoform X2 n=1 Tax=Actinidia eriantha TaxID=165200 RepID=UPI002586DF69|nr:uncharacterized protein LOC130758097 isoform X2 [Actinidia eriantha]